MGKLRKDELLQFFPAGNRRLLGTSTCHGWYGQIPRAIKIIESIGSVAPDPLKEHPIPFQASLFRVAHPFFFYTFWCQVTDMGL